MSKRFGENEPVIGEHYQTRAGHDKKDLIIRGLTLEDAATYVCRTVIQKGPKDVAIQHGTFWKLVVTHHQGMSIACVNLLDS